MSNYVIYALLFLSVVFNVYLNTRMQTLDYRIEELENSYRIDKFGSLTEALEEEYRKRRGRKDE